MDKQDYKVLGKTIEHAQKVLLTSRKKRQELLKSYLGDQHPSGDESKETPINLIKVAAHLYLQQILPGELRALVTPRIPAVETVAEGLERGTNERIKETNAPRETEAATHEALLSYGVVRVGEETTGTVDIDGIGPVETSATAVRHIPTNRFFYDTSAEAWPHIAFAGDVFTVPLYWAKDFEGFSKKVRKELKPLRLRDVLSTTGILRETEQQPSDQEYQPQTQLVNVWLPFEGATARLATLVPDSWDLLYETDWDGPEEGPYHRLTFNDIPGEIHPLPPLEVLRHLHAVANTLLAKIMTRIESSKELGLVDEDQQEVADQIINAPDGTWLRKKRGPAAVEFARMGGIGGDLVAMLIHMRRFFTWLGGGLDLMGGLQPQSETLGQDRILAAAANRTLQAMGKRVERFARGIVRALAWYEWTDPVRERVFMRTVEEGGHQYRFPTAWTPATRTGDFLDYDVQVDVYALQHRTPEERLNILRQSLADILPLYPLLQSQKATLDVRALVELMAKLRDLPELRQIIRGTTRRQPLELSEPPQQTGRPSDRRATPRRDQELEAADQLMAMAGREET